MVPTGEIACVEFHDARVREMQFGPGRDCVMRFSHLPVYHERGSGLYDVWSYRAEVLLLGVVGIEMQGHWSLDECIIEAELKTADGAVARLAAATLDVGTFCFRFFGAAPVVFRLSAMQLGAVDPLEKVEEWSGELPQVE